jgi:hypothetical protein
VDGSRQLSCPLTPGRLATTPRRKNRADERRVGIAPARRFFVLRKAFFNRSKGTMLVPLRAHDDRTHLPEKYL